MNSFLRLGFRVIKLPVALLLTWTSRLALPPPPSLHGMLVNPLNVGVSFSQSRV
ncbi:hypothetical protein SAMN03159391_03335 [Pseudomonas sp. NFACC37-1]|nr:hypothetical protein SAMN03159391_03335 [Pseudomonas sp. NFACC37-1]SFO47237.1 hypothetical protein SAMN03159304_03489 [Pseudomonas sp. NFACC24-1]